MKTSLSHSPFLKYLKIEVLLLLVPMVGFSVCFWWYLQPLQTAKELGNAVLARNYIAIRKGVDYDALKVNLQRNLHRIISQNNDAHHMHITPALAEVAADNGAAHMATPTGVQTLLAHVLPELGPKLEIAQYTGKFLSLSRYSVLVTGMSGGHIRAIFYRHGFARWKLGDIEMFPPRMPLDAYPNSATLREVRGQAPLIRALDPTVAKRFAALANQRANLRGRALAPSSPLRRGSSYTNAKPSRRPPCSRSLSALSPSSSP